MENVIKVNTPLSEEAVLSLNAGQEILLTGEIYTARDIAHKRLCDSISKGTELPFDLKGAVIYFVGPSPAREGNPIGSAGPTTSSRMDSFSPLLIKKGLRGMIGKGYRGELVRDAMSEYKAVHFAAIGGAGALLSKTIIASEVIAYDDLGTEAIRRLEVKDFPVVVAYDAHGNSVYNQQDA